MFIYLAVFSVNAAGIGLVIGLGTIIMMALGRTDDIVTTGVTTTVVLVVAALDALQVPQVTECPNCHEKIRAHRACPHCGKYKGREVIEVVEA